MGKNVATQGKVLSIEIFRNKYKYQSFSTQCSKIISKVKVSDRITELWNDRRDKNNMLPDIGGMKS